MFTVRKRHGSMSSLLINPQTTSKISIKKQMHQEKQTHHIKQKSSRMLPKIKPVSRLGQNESNNSQGKKNQKNNVQQLSIAINKYYIHRAQYIKKPFNQLSYDIMGILDCFSSIQNNFQQVFQFILKDLMSFVFMMQNQQLLTKYGIKQGQVYKKVVEDIDKVVSKKLKLIHQKLRQTTQVKEQIELEYGRERQLWVDKQKKLSQEIQWYKKITDRQYTAYLQDKLKQREQRIQELQQSQRALVIQRDQYEKQVQKQKDIIEEQQQEIAKLNDTVHDLRLGKEESEKIMLRLRDRFDQVALKMIGIKEIIEVVQQENDQLKTERVSLIKRAAVTFQQLTPRPKYAKIIKFTEDQSTRTIKATAQLTEVLLKKIGHQLNDEKFRNQLFNEKISTNKQMHPQLEHANSIRQHTIDSIVSSKHELRKLNSIANSRHY